MFESSLIDLDELALRCRTSKSRQYIQEAVSCYKAGANRACIVVTWIAVAYDILDKVRELDLAGDKEAKSQLARFRKCLENNNIQGALSFERELLDTAKEKFSLLSEIEFSELSRLREDRHRCAHPAFLNEDEVYLPSSELARNHLRNAVQMLLAHPPVQGKAALQSILQKIDSEYFPLNDCDAVITLKNSPLIRARPALVKNLLAVLLKRLLLEQSSAHQMDRYAAGLRATIFLHPHSAADLHQLTSDYVGAVSDQELPWIFATLRRIENLEQYLPQDAVLRLCRFVTTCSESQFQEGFASMQAVHCVISEVNERVKHVTVNCLLNLAEIDSAGLDAQAAERLVLEYEKASSFSAANQIAKVLLQKLSFLNAANAEKLLRSATNPQVRFSNRFSTLVTRVSEAKLLSADSVRTILEESGCNELLQ